MSVIPEDFTEIDKLIGYKPPPKPASSPVDISGLLDRMWSGASSVESGGSKDPQRVRNPRTGAIGLVQVLPENVRPWTKKHYKRELSPEEYANDPNAQRAVFDGEMGDYLRTARQQNPNADDETIIRMGAAGWYGGKGAMKRYDDPIKFRPNEASFREYTSSVAKRSKQATAPDTNFDDIDKLIGYGKFAKTPAPVDDFTEIDALIGYQPTQPAPVADGTIYGQPADAYEGGVTTSPTTPQPTDPVPETPETLQAQVASTFDVNSPKSMTLLTNGNPANNFILSMSEAKRLTRVNTPNGIVLVNTKKLGIKPSEATEYVKKNGFAKDSGFVIDMGDNTGDGQPAVAAVDPNTGKEVFAAVTPTPESAQVQAQQNQAMFPGTVQVQTDTDEVTAKRMAETPLDPNTIATAEPSQGGAYQGQLPDVSQLFPVTAKRIQQQQASRPQTKGVGQPATQPTTAQVAPTDAPPQAPPPTEDDYQQWREFMKLDDSPESRQQFQMALAVAPKTGSVDVSASVDALPDGQKLSEFEQETETADGGTLRFTREVGEPTDNLSGIVGTYRAPRGVSRKQAAIQAVANVGAKYGLTPQQASEFVNGLEKSGSSFILGKYDEKNGGEIKVDWQTLQNAGLDTKFAQRNEQVQNRLPDGVSNRDFGYTTEAEAAKNLEQRIKEPGYAAQEIASDALGDLLKSPQAAAQKLGWAFGNYWKSDDVPAPSETWVKSEKDRLLKQYNPTGDPQKNSYSKAWAGEQYYQNADALEKAIRFANQTSRSFVKNLVGGTVKSVLYLDNLLEPLGVNAMLPEKAKISIRNAANVADLFVRAMQGDTSTKNWQNSDTDLDKTTLFKSIQEFDKAVGDDPVLKGRLLGAGGDAFGSAMSFVAMAALMPSLKTTNFWGNVRNWDTAIAGALQSAGSGYEEGKNSKLTETQAKIYGGIQGLLGTTEALGAGAELAHLLKNDGMKTIRAKLAEGILEVARHGYKEGKQEFGQEVFQTTSGKIALEYLKDNDPSLIQKITNVLDRLPKQFRDTVTNEGLIALVTGGTMGAGTKAATTSISKDLDSDGQGDTKNKGTANIPVADLQSNKEAQQISAVEPKSEPKTDLLANKKAEKPKVTLEPVEDIAKSDKVEPVKEKVETISGVPIPSVDRMTDEGLSPVRERAKSKAAEKFGVKGEVVDVPESDFGNKSQVVETKEPTHTKVLDDSEPWQQTKDDYVAKGGDENKWVSSFLDKLNGKWRDIPRNVLEREAPEYAKQLDKPITRDIAERDAKPTIDLGTFVENKSALQRGKIEKILGKQYRHKGKVVTRQQYIDQIIADGGEIVGVPKQKIVDGKVVNYESDEPILKSAEGKHLFTTKTELDYAQHLIDSRAQPKAEAVKEPQRALDEILNTPVDDWVKRQIARTAVGKFGTETAEATQKRLADKYFYEHKNAVLGAMNSGQKVPDIAYKSHPDLYQNAVELGLVESPNPDLQARANRTAKLAARRTEKATNLEAAKAKVAERKEAAEARRANKPTITLPTVPIEKARVVKALNKPIEWNGVTTTAQLIENGTFISKDVEQGGTFNRAKYNRATDQEAYERELAEQKVYHLVAKNGDLMEVSKAVYDAVEFPDNAALRSVADDTYIAAHKKERSRLMRQRQQANAEFVKNPTPEIYAKVEAADVELAAFEKETKERAKNEPEIWWKDPALRSIPETDPLQGIITDRGSYDAEKLRDVAGRIERGEYSIERLGNAGEQGRIRGGRKNVELSTLLGASEAEHQAASRRGEQGVASRSSEIRRQENILERYAREAGIWLDPKFTNRQTRVGAGGEAVVYHKDGEAFVTKVVDYRHINRGTTPLEFLDRTSLFNALFPEAPYTLEGVTRIDGKLRFVIKQPYVNGGGVQHSVFAEAMKDRGWKPLERESYENSLYQVFDLHEKNVMQDADGNFYVIDAVPRAKHTQDFAIVRNDRSAYNADGDIDYAEVTDTAEKVVSGVHSIKRLTPAGEDGRVRSGQRGVEASIVVGTMSPASTDGGAGARKVAEEQALEKYAKHEGIWLDYNELVNKDLDYLAQGTEAKVYLDQNDPGFVTKLTPIPVVFGADSSVLRFFDDKLGIHNSLPFTVPYELVGFTRDNGGTFLAVLRQPFIQGKEITAPVAEFSKAMQSEGLLPRVGGGYQNSQFKVLDIDDHNVIQSADGKFHIIDPIVSYADDAMYQPFTVVRPDEALRSVADVPQSQIDAVKEVRNADGKLLAPNGKVSNLNERQWKEVRTPNFIAFFGDWINDAENASKVVDENGEPLVLKHGSTGDFDVFDLERTPDVNLSSGKGVYLTTSDEAASIYAKGVSWGNQGVSEQPNIVPVYANIRKPFNKNAQYKLSEFASLEETSKLRKGAERENAPSQEWLNETDETLSELQNYLWNLENGTATDLIELYEEEIDARLDPEDYDNGKNDEEYITDAEKAVEDEIKYVTKQIDRYEKQIEDAWDRYRQDNENATVAGYELWDGIKKSLPEYYDLEAEKQLFGGDVESFETDTEVARILAEFGFDGVERTDTFPIGKPHKVFIANQNSGQLKSAIGNNGNFDPSDPSILRKVAEQGDIADIEALGKGDFKELFNDIKSDVKSDANGANILDLGTNKTIELVRTAFAYMYDTPLEGTAIPGGMYLDPSQTNDFRDALQGIMDAASEAGIESKGVDTLIKNLDKAAKDGDVRVIGFQDTLPHETIHQQSRRGAIDKELSQRYSDDGLGDDPVFNKFHKKLVEIQGKASLAVAREEALAYLSSGDYARFGLTEAEATEIVAKLIESYAAKNGVQSLKTFDGTQAYEAVNEYRRKSDSRETSDDSRSEVGSERETPPETAESKRAESDTGERGETFTPGGEEKLSKTPSTLRKGGIPVQERLYTSTTDAERQAFANERMDDGLDAAMKWTRDQLDTKNNNAGATGVVGVNVMVQLGKEGRIAELNKFADDLLPAYTDSAQMIQSLAVVSMFSPDTAGAYVTKVAKQNGQDVTPEQVEKALEIATRMSEVVQADGITEHALNEAKAESERLTKDIADLTEALGLANDKNKQFKGKLSGQGRTIAALRRQIEGETKPSTRLPGAVKKHVKEIVERKDDILERLKQKYGGNPILRMVAPSQDTALRSIADTELDQDAVDAATIHLSKNLGKQTPAQVKDAINVLTNGQMTKQQIDDVYAAAVSALRIERTAMDADTKAANKLRQGHYREADKINDAKLTEWEKKLSKPDTKFVNTTVREGVENGYTDEAIWFALARKHHPNVNDALKALREEFPEADTRTIIRDSERLTQAVKARIAADIAQRQNQFTLNDEDIALIKEERRVNTHEKQKVTRDANRFYSGMVKGAGEIILDTIVNMRRANLLTAVKTHFVNIGGNVGFAIGEEIARAPSTVVDLAASIFTGERTTTLSAKAIGNGLKALVSQDETLKNSKWDTPEGKERGITAARHVLQYGGSIADMERLQHSESILSAKFENRAARWVDNYINGVFKTLGAEDAFFKVYAFRRHIEEQARAIAITERRQDKSVNLKERIKELVANPTNVMQVQADRYAHFMTFQNDNALSGFIASIKRGRPGLKAGVETIMPYDRTPTNIVVRVMEYTPAGMVIAPIRWKGAQRSFDRNKPSGLKFRNELTGAVKADLAQSEDFNNLPETERRKIIEATLQKVFTREQQETFAKTIGRSSLGTGLFSLGFVLAAAGLMAGAMSYDDDDKTESTEAEKRKKAGIENGSIQTPWGRIVLPKSPPTMAMLAGATFYEQMSISKKSPLIAAVDAGVEAFSDMAKEVPLINSTSSVLRSLGKGKFGEFTGNIASGFVPASAMLNALSNLTDDKERTGSGYKKDEKIKSPEQYLNYQGRGLRNSFIKGIPWLRQYADESTSGVSDIERGGIGRRIVRILDPFNTRTEAPPQPGTVKEMIDGVVTYAKAIGTDPITAFKIIYKGERIRRVDNNAIIVERMDLEDSQKVKKDRNASKDERLDHAMPLQLGGLNDEGNLELRPENEWARFTPVENALGRALRAEKITKEEAQKLMRDYKNGDITEADITSFKGGVVTITAGDAKPRTDLDPKNPIGNQSAVLKFKEIGSVDGLLKNNSVRYWSTDDWVAVMDAATLTDADRQLAADALRKKADNAQKSKSLTPEELERIKRVLPDYAPKQSKMRKLADMSYAKNNGRDFEPEYNDSREKWKGMRQSENVIDRREDAPLTQFMRDLNGGLDTIQRATFTGGTLAERREARKMLNEQILESRYVLKNKKADPQQARAVLKALLDARSRLR